LFLHRIFLLLILILLILLIIIITSSTQTVRSFALIFYTYVSWVNRMKMETGSRCGRVSEDTANSKPRSGESRIHGPLRNAEEQGDVKLTFDNFKPSISHDEVRY
jgi:hypothetical protein